MTAKQIFSTAFIVIGIVALFIGIRMCNKGVEASHFDDSVQVYEEFQEIFNTVKQLQADICQLRSQNENDKMFNDFSKSSQIYAKQTQINRWVNTYNAKSHMWGRNLWKSQTLPQTLNEQDYYNCN